MQVLKAGLLYFLLAFAAGWLLGPIREFAVVPRLGRTAGILLEAPVMLLVMVAAARWVIRRRALSRAFPIRIAVGGSAFALLLVAEIAGVLWVRRLSLMDYLAGFDVTTGTVSLTMYLLFAVMPVLVERTRTTR